MKNFFLSLKTTVWVLFVLVCLFLAGAFLMPANREVFGSMNDGLLLAWAAEIAAVHPWQTWWLFASVAGLAVLTANTIVCSFEAVRGKWSRDRFLLRIAPQIIHAGFLFILLAHLISAVSGFKVSGLLPEGGRAVLPDGTVFVVHDIRVQSDASGYPRGWSAAVSLYEKSGAASTGTLGPNRPCFHDGTGIYLKDLNFEAGPAAFLLVARDPGAVWALAGGVLFLCGSVILLAVKWRQA